MRLLLLGIAGLLPTLSASAHDLWLENDGKSLTLLQGHRYSGHGGAETLSYEPGLVRAATCVDQSGTAKSLPLPRSAPMKITADCAAVQVVVSSGYWTKTPWETKNVAKTGISSVLKSWLSEESVKRVDRWTTAMGQPLGDGLEIVPLGNPLLLKPDDKLTVRVVDARQARAGVPVAYGGDVRGSTGPDGTIAIRIRHGGVQLITASLETPLTDGKADTHVRSAALQFDLPK